MSDFNDVGEFHQKFGLDNVTHFLPGPRPYDRSLIMYRAGFLLEELREFFEAVGVKIVGDQYGNLDLLDLGDKPIDHAQAFDALIDLNYVSLGTAHLLGYPWREGWELVQNANMAKQRAASAEESAAGTGRGHALDVIKPEGWTPPNIEGLVKDYGFELPVLETPRHYPKDVDQGGYCNSLVMRVEGEGDVCGLLRQDPVHYGHRRDGEDCFYELCGSTYPCIYSIGEIAKFQQLLDEETDG